MSFSYDMLNDMGVFFATDEFAKAGVYNDGTQESDITVLIESDTNGAVNTGIEAMAYVSMTEIPTPEYRHTITVDGVKWTVDQKKHGAGYKNDGYVWHLPLIRETRSTQWRR